MGSVELGEKEEGVGGRMLVLCPRRGKHYIWEAADKMLESLNRSFRESFLFLDLRVIMKVWFDFKMAAFRWLQ